MNTVYLPGRGVNRVQVFAVLLLSGLAVNTRWAKKYVNYGFVYVNGEQILSIKATLEVNKPYTVEVRFPHNRTKSLDLTIVEAPWLGFPRRNMK